MYELYGGENRFAFEEEINNSTVKIKITEPQTSAGGLPIFSDGETMYVDNTDAHSLIIGSTGSGKSRRIFIPLLLSLAKSGSSLVVNDPKAELYASCYHLLKELGYKIIILDFQDPKRGERYNLYQYPIELYRDKQVAKSIEFLYEIAHGLFAPLQTQDVFWTNSSENYLLGLSRLACDLIQDEPIDLGTLYDIHLAGNERVPGTGASYFQEYFKRYGRKNTDTWRLLESTVNAPEATNLSIISVMTQGLSRYMCNDEILELLSGKMEWSPKELGKKKIALFILNKADRTLYNSVISAIVNQIYMILSDLADEYNGVLPQRVEFVLDEFSNMAPLTDINEKMSISRSKNIRFFLGIQSLEQLSLKYTKNEAKILMGNCSNWAYLHSSDLELLSYISDRAGTKNKRYTGEKHALLPVTTLQHLEKGQCLYFHGRNYPVVNYLPDISEYNIDVSKFNVNSIPIRQPYKRRMFDFKAFVEDERMKILDEFLNDTVKHEDII